MVCLLKSVVFLNRIFFNEFQGALNLNKSTLVSDIDSGSFSIMALGDAQFVYGFADTSAQISSNLIQTLTQYKVDLIDDTAIFYVNNQSVFTTTIERSSGIDLVIDVISGNFFLEQTEFFYNTTDDNNNNSDNTSDQVNANNIQTDIEVNTQTDTQAQSSESPLNGRVESLDNQSSWYEIYSPTLITAGILVFLVAVLFYIVPKRSQPAENQNSGEPQEPPEPEYFGNNESHYRTNNTSQDIEHVQKYSPEYVESNPNYPNLPNNISSRGRY